MEIAVEDWLEGEIRFLSGLFLRGKPCIRKLDNATYTGKSYFFRASFSHIPKSAEGKIAALFSNCDVEASIKCAYSNCGVIDISQDSHPGWLLLGCVCFDKDQRSSTVLKRLNLLHPSACQLFVLFSPFHIWSLFMVSNARRMCLKDYSELCGSPEIVLCEWTSITAGSKYRFGDTNSTPMHMPALISWPSPQGDLYVFPTASSEPAFLTFPSARKKPKLTVVQESTAPVCGWPSLNSFREIEQMHTEAACLPTLSSEPMDIEDDPDLVAFLSEATMPRLTDVQESITPPLIEQPRSNSYGEPRLPTSSSGPVDGPDVLGVPNEGKISTMAEVQESSTPLTSEAMSNWLGEPCLPTSSIRQKLTVVQATTLLSIGEPWSNCLIESSRIEQIYEKMLECLREVRHIIEARPEGALIPCIAASACPPKEDSPCPSSHVQDM